MKAQDLYRQKYKIIKFFNKEQLNIIHKDLKTARWEPGLVTLDHSDRKVALRVKSNFQTDYDASKFYGMVDRCNEFAFFTEPKTSSSIIISKTPAGGYYKPHTDWEALGHYSTTIFLNDPDTYGGGELCILPNPYEDEVKIKLEAGWGITYETGTPHRVATVTQGERLVSVFWTESKIKDLNDLDRYRYYSDMYEFCGGRAGITRDRDLPVFETCHEYQNNAMMHFERKRKAIMKKYSKMS